MGIVLWIVVFYFIGVLASIVICYLTDIGVFNWCLNPLLDSKGNSELSQLTTLTYRELFKYGVKSWFIVGYLGIPIIVGIIYVCCKTVLDFILGNGNPSDSNPSDNKEPKTSWLDKTIHNPLNKEKEKETIGDENWHLAKVKKERE
jgi:hypothetical protein